MPRSSDYLISSESQCNVGSVGIDCVKWISKTTDQRITATGQEHSVCVWSCPIGLTWFSEHTPSRHVSCRSLLVSNAKTCQCGHLLKREKYAPCKTHTTSARFCFREGFSVFIRFSNTKHTSQAVYRHLLCVTCLLLKGLVLRMFLNISVIRLCAQHFHVEQGRKTFSLLPDALRLCLRITTASELKIF